MFEDDEEVKKTSNWFQRFKENKVAFRTTAVLVGLLVFIVVVRSCNAVRKSGETEATKTSTTVSSSTTTSSSLSDYEQDQAQLIKRYGDPSKGYRWDDDGNRIPIGDPNLSKTEVVNTFIKALQTLDFATAQKYSYKDKVVTQMEKYYADDSDFTYDTAFQRNMYEQVLLSIEPVTVESASTFADDKANMKVVINLLDLSNKDFWQDDSDKIFEELLKYKTTEADTTKARNYLYDYVYDYWKSEEAQKKKVEISFVLSKIDGSWLVTTDTDLDNYAKYADGETVINNILENYNDWYDDYVNEKQESNDALGNEVE